MSLRPGVKNYCDDIEEEDNKVGETNFQIKISPLDGNNVKTLTKC